MGFNLGFKGLNLWRLEFLVKGLHGLRTGSQVTQPSRTCGEDKNPCSHLDSKFGLQKRTYQFTDRAILVGNNIGVNSLSFGKVNSKSM